MKSNANLHLEYKTSALTNWKGFPKSEPWISLGWALQESVPAGIESFE